MPFYDYNCLSCDHRFEVLQKLSDPAPARCPACGHERVEKAVSAPAIQSSGGGGHVHGPNCRH
ncbi:FmdB family zinc ribbon protein [Novosphingobium sp. JCM 18896]|uniref:FmdB family zinc ribbon protein n=1 Tax=Novosphingobium sp. JCM 18896 TaxID=2989731 RepID=UPI00222305CA|nr:zinc ribbon domain-containing protein [Novosphingobium sp. JCM 18896]MCW1429739.1 zinc ribbon domain-containing protein [Novosphingobium sp. JCM 18896]